MNIKLVLVCNVAKCKNNMEPALAGRQAQITQIVMVFTDEIIIYHIHQCHPRSIFPIYGPTLVIHVSFSLFKL